jgi:flagellar basal-body rod modification protein FlgD
MATIPTSNAANAAANATTTGASQNSGSNALAQFSSNFQDFLSLLTTQLKNQDPMSPMDSTQFTSQLVQFTGVEQGILQNQNLQQLISLQSNTQMANAVSYIGKTINNAGSEVQLSSSQGTINYTVNDPATTKVNITITDSSGTVIRTVTDSSPVQGAQGYQWDGHNNTGSVVPDGTYNVKVQGLDANGNPTTVTTGTSGVVSNVNINGGQIILTTAGGMQVPLSDVKSISAASGS